MQNSDKSSSLYKDDYLDFNTNKSSNNDYKQSFLLGVQNARYLLNKLDRSIQRTSKYETRLLQCKTSHAHMHDSNEQCAESQLLENESMSLKTEKPSTSLSRSPIDLAASWSTMSIVCLQYQYEELSKRYESLLQAYDERCNSLHARDVSLQRLRERVKETQAQLVCTHEGVLAMGEKYLNLRFRKLAQKCWYEDNIRSLRQKLQKVLSEAERVLLEMDEHVTRCLHCEHDTAIALLLAETQKCSHLFLENMRLKVKMDELTSK